MQCIDNTAIRKLETGFKKQNTSVILLQVYFADSLKLQKRGHQGDLQEDESATVQSTWEISFEVHVRLYGCSA